MLGNIIGQVVNKIKQAGQRVALQLDEMTDVSGDAQLLAFCTKAVKWSLRFPLLLFSLL